MTAPREVDPHTDWPPLTKAETNAPCPPLSFTGGRCANPEPLPHACWGAATSQPQDAAHDTEARQEAQR